MSLLQELKEFEKLLIEKYHRDDMPQIVEHYCQSRIETNNPDYVADNYVLQADKDRYYKEHAQLNSGHVYTGIMEDKLLYDKFDEWYKENYITYEEENNQRSTKKEYLKPEVGRKLTIINMVGEPQYAGKSGIIERIDGVGQLHGTWGGCAVIPGEDAFELEAEEENNKGYDIESKKDKGRSL